MPTDPDFTIWDLAERAAGGQPVSRRATQEIAQYLLRLRPEGRRARIFAAYVGRPPGYDQPPAPGDLVMVELPSNCSIHAIPGRTAADIIRIVDCARRVGEHWRSQDGINAALLDELAEATRE